MTELSTNLWDFAYCDARRYKALAEEAEPEDWGTEKTGSRAMFRMSMSVQQRYTTEQSQTAYTSVRVKYALIRACLQKSSNQYMLFCVLTTRVGNRNGD